MAVDLVAGTDLDCSVERAHRELAELAGYPVWCGIVWSATRLEGDEPAWSVLIGARVGLLRQSKRLRMVRTADDAAEIRFERREEDGRPHSPWILTVWLAPEPTRVEMRLHYGGAVTVPLLDRVMAAEMARSGRRLRERLDRVG